MIRLSALVALLVACGGTDQPAPSGPAGSPDGEHAAGEHDGAKHDGKHGAKHDGKHDGEHDGKHNDEHGELPTEVKAFHDVLSPLWHADVGAKRTDDTCAAVKAMADGAMKVAKAPAPTGADGAAWTQAGEGLVAAVTDLETTCGNPERRGMFDAGFKDVHEAFHAILAAGGHEKKQKK